MAFNINLALDHYGELEEIQAVNPSGAILTAHQPTVFEDKIIISKNGLAIGATGWFWCKGVFKVSKNTAVALSAGDIAYWDITDGNVNADNKNNKPMGVVLVDAGASDAFCYIKLNEYAFQEARSIVSIKNDSGADLAVGGVLPTKPNTAYSRIYVASEAVTDSATGKFYSDIACSLAKNPAVAFTRGIIVNWLASTSNFLTTATVTTNICIAGRVLADAGTGVSTAVIDIADRG